MEASGTKLFFGGLLLIAALLVIFQPEATRPAPEGATVITFSFWGTYEEWEMWREIVGLFHKSNPDITVKMNYIPSQYDDKIRLLLAADCAPDVMLLQDEPFPAYAGYGKLEDLTERVNSADCPLNWVTDFFPTATDSFAYRGRVMGVPILGGNCLIFYNRKMFREAGVPFPDDEHWTFEDFVSISKKLTRDTDGDGKLDTFGFSLPNWIYFMPFTWGFGVDYLNDSRTDWAFTGSAAVESLCFYQNLRYGFRISPSITEMPNYAEGAMFMTGHVAMFCNGPWACPTFGSTDIDFDLAHIPFGPSGKRYTRVTWDGLSMFSKSRHKDAAWRFMLHCVSVEAQAVAGRTTRNFPSIVAAKDSFTNPNNGWQEDKFFDALEYSEIQPITNKWDAMANVLAPVYERVSLNKLTPEDAVTQIESNIRKEHVFPIEDRE